jgi:TadE-like protein
MPPEPRDGRVPSPRDGGAVAVETAVVSMFLIILLMGIVESAFFFKDWTTVATASRAGARMGASQSKSPTFATTTADQVTNTISGLPPTSLASIEVWIYDARFTVPTSAAGDGLPTGTAVGVAPSANNCTTKCLKFTWDAGLSKLVPASPTPGAWDYHVQNACIGDPLRSHLGVYVKFPHYSPLGFFFQNATVAESTMMWLEPYNPITTCKT